jgi:iron complex transport system ATP-binding protein
MIALKGAGIRRGERWIFRGLDLTLAPGRCVAVLGPNGRGKTTLIKVVTGLDKLDEGTRTAPSLVAYVPQVIAPLPYRALDVVVMARARSLGLFGTPRRADYDIAREALARIGAEAFAEQRLDRLSGGERQLVLLARALATQSPVLVLDEPASALDLANQSRLVAVLRDLRAAGEHAILFSTHLPTHALEVADEALLLMGPEDQRQGPVDTVMSESNLSALYGTPLRRRQVAIEGHGLVETIIPLH